MIEGEDSSDASGTGDKSDVAPFRHPSAVRRVFAGTMAYKLGMESMTTAVPFVAMSLLGSVTGVALLVVGVFGTAQAVAGAYAGSLVEKLPAKSVLGGAVAVQAVVVAATFGLGSVRMLPSWALFALYAAAGAAVGAAETSRHVVPGLLLGRDETALSRYNATLHRYYEVAGVVGSATAGVVIWRFGALAALAVTPVAAAIAAVMFSTVKHPRPPTPRPEKAGRGPDDFGMRAAVRLMLGDRHLRAAAVAMLLPQIIHRVFENLMLPVYAKRVLGHEALSAALLTASNLGEFIGASLLLRYARRFPGPYRWVTWSAYAAVGAWGLSLAPALGLSGVGAVAAIAPLILLFSMTWAGSHLSLESHIQGKVDPARQPRVLGLLVAAYVGGAAVASLLVGWLFDSLTLSHATSAVNTVFTASLLLVWFLARRLRGNEARSAPSSSMLGRPRK